MNYESPDETSEVENLDVERLCRLITHSNGHRGHFPISLVGNFDYSAVYRLYVEEPQSECIL